MNAKANYSIREASVYLDVSEMYIRKMLSQGKIRSTKIAVSANSKVLKHSIAREELDAFRAKTSTRSSRSDNRNKFTLYATREEEIAIRALLKSNKLEALEALLARTNQK